MVFEEYKFEKLNLKVKNQTFKNHTFDGDRVTRQKQMSFGKRWIGKEKKKTKNVKVKKKVERNN